MKNTNEVELQSTLGPHFGGDHESLIKSAKQAIYVIFNNANICDKELQIAIVAAQYLMNCRPLLPPSTVCRHDLPLKPNHFLTGQVGGVFAPGAKNASLQRRCRRVQELVSHFWR